MSFDLKKAAEELSKKTLQVIELENSYAYASRAVIALQNFNKSKDIRWYLDAIEYEKEAYQTAALVEAKKPGTLKEIQSKISPLHNEALLHLKKKSFV